MPLYEYRCDHCQHLTEALRSMAAADDPLACEKCGRKETRRALSVFAAGKSNDMSAPAPGGCGRCGDPRGPGAGRMG
ncbi:MAG: zinc ribbon domain-containing protein [Phycisphaeraceae bacterium]|nr:zinc ribbon domain-containing protein [Phycisphaeraceae bacterium]